MRWIPQAGGQRKLAFAAGCIKDIFYGGERGSGKTSAAVGLFQNSYIKYQSAAQGIIFRKTYNELEGIKKECDKQFLWLGATYNTSKNEYTFPEGNKFKLRYLERDEHADRYQGDEYTYICVDEAGNHRSFAGINRLWGCLRSTAPGVKFAFLKTGNPGGPGHNLLKNNYVSPSPWGQPFKAKIKIGDKETEVDRIFIPGKFNDNQILKNAQPDYQQQLYQTGPKWLVDAWCSGNWDIVAGGALDDLWDRKVHICQPFDMPDNWTITRSLDWGSAAPFSVLFIAKSNGEHTPGAPKHGRGTMFVIGEWYGADNQGEGLKLTSKQVARGVKQRQPKRCKKGAADAAIWSTQDEACVADNMKSEGIQWIRADNSKGSRKAGLQAIRLRLKNQIDGEGAGLVIFNTVTGLISRLPVLGRNKKDMEDVDSDQEDHDYDALRYEVNRNHIMPVRFTNEFWK